MSESSTADSSTSAQQIPEELALEDPAHGGTTSPTPSRIIVQTSYLLSRAELTEPATDWLRMLESGVNKALELNLELQQLHQAAHRRSKRSEIREQRSNRKLRDL